MLPRELAYAGIVFQLAPGDKANAFVPRGQTIPVPAGVRRLYVLAASATGDPMVTFHTGMDTLFFTIPNWSGFIGQWDDRQWKQTEVVVPPRATPPDVPSDIAALLQRSRTRRDPYGEMTGITPGFIKRAHIAWFASHRHTPAARMRLTPIRTCLLIRSTSLAQRRDAAEQRQHPHHGNHRLKRAKDGQPAHPLYDT
jgi:alpha-mannosidase